MTSGTNGDDRPNYDGKVFMGTVGYEGDDGDFNERTVIRYYQNGNVLWGTCENDGTIFSVLSGFVRDDGSLDFSFSFARASGVVGSGRCSSTLEVLDDGRFRLHESWRELDGGSASGTSIIEERE
ncbi:MAG TPA: n-acetylglutamate synthase [Candidatus Kapabacteria bacterium]|nr:n-acetylglutamate synthase [Candidatus Kapabacteria bacterium]